MQEKPPLKYQQIIDAFEHLIDRGLLKPGDRMASENALAEKYNCSRGTVVRAMDELARMRLIERIQGKGTFIRGRLLPNAWEVDKVAALMEGLAELNPTLRADHPHEEIVIELNDGEEISIFRPDEEKWTYEVSYLWPVDPFGYSESQAAYNHEDRVIGLVREIYNQGGIRLEEEAG